MDVATIETALAENGSVLEVPIGNSMKPMLKDRRDAIVISRLTREPKRGDVILFTSASGECVLHRVIRTKPDGYLTRGDNCTRDDGVVPREKVIGILSGYYKGERFIDCEKSARYKLYVVCSRASYLPRRAYRAVRSALSKLKNNTWGSQ